MLALTWFLSGNGSVIAALAKGILLFAVLAGVVLLTAWLGTAFFAASGLALGKTLAIGGVFAALAKLPALLGALL